MQLANKVTVKNKGFGPIVDEVVEAFAGQPFIPLETYILVMINSNLHLKVEI